MLPPGRPLKVLRTPAVAQQQRDGEQPWVLAGGPVSDTTDEPVEVIAHVEFFQQGVQQAPRPRETARALGQDPKVIEAAVPSPVMNLDALGRPSRSLCARASSACGSVAHGRHLRLSARL